MPISSTQTSFFGSGSLLINNFRLSVRSTEASQTVERTNQPQSNSTLNRINFLVSRVKDQLLESAQTGESFSDRQTAIDASLTEISGLLGESLALGGSANAVFEGLNEDQIADVQVLSLPPNGEAKFSGSLSRDGGQSRVFVTDASRLQSGGSLAFKIGQSNQNVRIPAGSSVSGIASRVNSANLGIRASVFDGRLTLTSNRSSSFEATVKPLRVTQTTGENQVSSVNASQVTNVDISGLQAGASQVISGSRDSLATSATLTYAGDANGNVRGSATFDLSGRLGTASITAVEGESLTGFADRVNNASSTTGVNAEVSGNELRFVSDISGDSGEVRVSNVTPQYRSSVEGVNASQLSPFNLLSIGDGDEITLNGSITTAADNARLTYQGASGGVVVDTARFTVSGNSGSAEIDIVQNESLTDVRDRVNSETASTGVIATVSGNELEFRSENVGSSQNVSVTLDEITQYVDVDGVNAAQVSNFNVVSSSPRSTDTLNATVTRAATQGELSYSGFLGATRNAATFTLTGDLGSAEIETSNLELLTSVRDSINDVTDQTGVVASVSGSTLTLTSQGFGSSGIVEVDVQSGTFNTSGGDGNGNAAGLDALLNINGDSVTASGNSVAYSDALGSYTFDVNPNFVGAIDPITVTTSDGEFDIVGGDGSGSAIGVDAEATVNGQGYIATGRDFDLTIDSANVTFAVVDGFTGSIDPITLRSTPDDFTVIGGDGNGFDRGQDSIATINGTVYTSADDTFNITTAEGNVGFTFASDFIGQFDDVEIDSDSSTRRRSGSPTTYRSKSRVPTATVNGNTLTKVDDRFELEQDGVRLSIQFADGFDGQFDSFTVATEDSSDQSDSALYAVPTLQNAQTITTLQSALAGLFQIASGGALSSSHAAPVDAFSVAVEAVRNLSSLIGGTTLRGRSLAGITFDSFA